MTVSHDEVEPITETVHENSWSANLEQPHHGADRELIERQAVEVVDHTAPGNHVNLVTHGDHGHPATYLYDVLDETFDDIEHEYVEQCGCGGHVTRVHVYSSHQKSLLTVCSDGAIRAVSRPAAARDL
jgi:putative CGCGG family rSAM target protein